MSPVLVDVSALPSGFPRVSGDEPASAFRPLRTLVFSPRERG